MTRNEDTFGAADFTVTLTRVSSQPVSFTVATRDGTAQNASGGVGADDYDSPASTLTIGAGSLTGVVHVPVNSDSVYEADETAYVDVSLANGETGAVGSTATGYACTNAFAGIASAPGISTQRPLASKTQPW